MDIILNLKIDNKFYYNLFLEDVFYLELFIQVRRFITTNSNIVFPIREGRVSDTNDDPKLVRVSYFGGKLKNGDPHFAGIC